MEPRTFPDDPIPNQLPDVGPGVASFPADISTRKARAVAELLRNKSLSDTFGKHGAFEVRTTIETRHTWRYRCRIFRRGKEVKRGFSPLDVDRTRDIRREPSITEEMRLAFADEAVEGHFALAAAVRDYLLMVSIHAGSPPQHSPFPSIALVTLVCAALVTGYWFWRHQYPAYLLPTRAKPPVQMVRWKQDQVFYQHPAGLPFAFFLPKPEHMSTSVPVTIALDPSSPRPNWLEFDPKALLLSGVAPMVEDDQDYHLVVEARIDDGTTNRLDVYATIIGEPQPVLQQVPQISTPVPSDRPAAKDCLLKILKGEPCSEH